MPVRLWLAAAVLCAFTTGCARPIPNSLDSPETLARAVLAAVAQRDEAALRRLAVDEEEFRRHVWADLPASRPERNTPFGYVWTDLRTKSDAGLAVMLVEHGGQVYDLEAIRFKGGVTQYKTYLVHRESILDVRDRDGRRRTLRLFGSTIEKGGGFKVFSYVVE